MLLPLIVFIPLFGALLPALLGRLFGTDPARTAGLITAVALSIPLAQAAGVFGGEAFIQSWPWMPALGLNFAFRLDGFALLFALLILGMGLLIVIYAHYYLGPKEPKERFYGLLLFFMGSMLGIVLAENLLLLAIFWELTSLSSFLLIGFWRHDPEARQGARLALLITGAGGLALLAGILVLGNVVGSYELSDVLNAGPLIRAHPSYPAIVTLVLAGAFTKSAQFPVHFWLPHAMSAPTPVSAYLHSATMVKAGIFLLGRLFPALAGTELWFFAVSGTGFATLLIGAYIAMYRHDLKGLLAYSTVSHLGLITVLFGLGTVFGAIAATFHIINHAVFKASLFMSAGIIDHETGTRDMRRLSGLARYMPQTAVLAIIAAGAMAGVPLLNGFLSKEMFFAETLEVGWLGPYYWVPPVAALFAGVFSVAYSARFAHDVFFGPAPKTLDRTPHEPPRWMKMPVAVLVALCLVVGLMPHLTVQPLLDVAASSVLQDTLPDYEVKLWHGFNLPLAMSVVALAGGTLVYVMRRELFRLHGYSTKRGGKVLVEGAIAVMLATVRSVVPRVENDSLQRYMLLLFLTAVAALGTGLWNVTLRGSAPATAADPIALVATGILVAATLLTVVMHRRRRYAVIAAGVVGLVVSLAFVRLSAPDLALTQLLVEIVTIILLLLALFYLPQESPRESTFLRRIRDIAIATVSGGAVAALCWALLTRPFSSISEYFIENAKPEGGGHNVVNVILVDFRGLDTLGEISVLGIAAVAIVAMLHGLQLHVRELDWQGRPWAPDRHPVMLGVIARPLLPLALLVTVYLFLRGHNAPGGGFIAGLVAGTAIILQYIAYGTATARTLLPLSFMGLVSAGVATAALTGLGSWFFGAPFLTSTYGHVHWPIVGEFELASAMLFDLGVFLVVVGAVLNVLSSLGALHTPPVAAETEAAGRLVPEPVSDISENTR